MDLGIKKIWEKLFGNTIDRISERDLRGETIRLENEAKKTKNEISKLEKEKAKLFSEGIGADKLTKKMLVGEMDRKDMEAKLNLRDFMVTQKQLQFTKNLLVVKKFENKLKQTDIWKKLSAIPVRDLETKLIDINLEGRMFEEVLDSLNGVFKMEVASMETEQDESEKKVMDTWAAVESGKLDVKDAAKELSIEKSLEKEEEG